MGTNFIQILIIIIGLYIGGRLSNRSNLLHEQLEHAIPVKHTSMDHGLLEVGDDHIVPSIDTLILEKDKMSGWNLLIETSNFRFTPENVNTPHQPGQGHAHVYINNEKYARIYAPVLHLPELIGDSNELRITLNANGHETLAINGKAIERIITIQ